LEKAAKEAGGELIVLGNDFDEKTAVANAEAAVGKGSQSIESWIAAATTENLETCRSKTNGGVVMQRRVRELQY